MLMSVAINQNTRKHLMATPTTAAAPPIQRPRSRHTPRSRKPPRIILSVCISEILPPNIQKAADGDAMLYNSPTAELEMKSPTPTYRISPAPPSMAWGPELPRTRPPTSAHSPWRLRLTLLTPALGPITRGHDPYASH